MTHRIVLAVAAGAISIAIACLVLLGAGWFSEALVPAFIVHHRAVAVVAPMVGTFAGMFPIFVVYHYRKPAPQEEPLKPRIP